MALLIFGFMFGVMTESGYCLGDHIIRSLGFKAWSMESAIHRQNGFHYTFLFSLAFIILGYAGTKHNLKNIYPRFVKLLPVIVILLFFNATLLFNWGYGLFLSFSDGVYAVDYVPSKSNCNFTSDQFDDVITYNYDISLKNHANKKVTFNMQVQKPLFETAAMWDVRSANSKSGPALKQFTLAPREEREFRFVMEEKDPGHSSYNGSMHRPNLIIYNTDGSRQFLVH